MMGRALPETTSRPTRAIRARAKSITISQLQTDRVRIPSPTYVADVLLAAGIDLQFGPSSGGEYGGQVEDTSDMALQAMPS